VSLWIGPEIAKSQLFLLSSSAAWIECSLEMAAENFVIVSLLQITVETSEGA
jgi:hypothetical protein